MPKIGKNYSTARSLAESGDRPSIHYILNVPEKEGKALDALSPSFEHFTKSYTVFPAITFFRKSSDMYRRPLSRCPRALKTRAIDAPHPGTVLQVVQFQPNLHEKCRYSHTLINYELYTKSENFRVHPFSETRHRISANSTPSDL